MLKEKIHQLQMKLNLYQKNIGVLFNYAPGTEQARMSKNIKDNSNSRFIQRIYELLEFVYEKGLLNEFIKKYEIKFYPQRGNARGMGRKKK